MASRAPVMLDLEAPGLPLSSVHWKGAGVPLEHSNVKRKLQIRPGGIWVENLGAKRFPAKYDKLDYLFRPKLSKSIVKF